MKRNAFLPVAIIICLLVACALTSCCARKPDKTPETDAEQEGGTTHRAERATSGRVEHETVVTSGELELKAVVTVPARQAGELVPGAVIVHTFGPLGRDGRFRQLDITFTPYSSSPSAASPRSATTSASSSPTARSSTASRSRSRSSTPTRSPRSSCCATPRASIPSGFTSSATARGPSSCPPWSRRTRSLTCAASC